MSLTFIQLFKPLNDCGIPLMHPRIFLTLIRLHICARLLFKFSTKKHKTTECSAVWRVIVVMKNIYLMTQFISFICHRNVASNAEHINVDIINVLDCQSSDRGGRSMTKDSQIPDYWLLFSSVVYFCKICDLTVIFRYLFGFDEIFFK